MSQRVTFFLLSVFSLTNSQINFYYDNELVFVSYSSPTLNQAQSLSYCQNNFAEGTLASITSSAIQNRAETLFASAGFNGNQGIYIGAVRTGANCNGCNPGVCGDATYFEWVNGDTWSWTNWDGSTLEPDNCNAQCGRVVRTTYLWRDAICTEARDGMLCEYNHLGTTDPSNNPSSNPTIDPTNNPTNNPTNQPSNNPTQIPTIQTSNPSKQPSLTPTDNPSQIPTNNPSQFPSLIPSVNPTNNPTLIETLNGTITLTISNSSLLSNVSNGDLIILITNAIAFASDLNANLLDVELNYDNDTTLTFDITYYGNITSNYDSSNIINQTLLSEYIILNSDTFDSDNTNINVNVIIVVIVNDPNDKKNNKNTNFFNSTLGIVLIIVIIILLVILAMKSVAIAYKKITEPLNNLTRDADIANRDETSHGQTIHHGTTSSYKERIEMQTTKAVYNE